MLLLLDQVIHLGRRHRLMVRLVVMIILIGERLHLLVRVYCIIKFTYLSLSLPLRTLLRSLSINIVTQYQALNNLHAVNWRLITQLPQQ